MMFQTAEIHPKGCGFDQGPEQLSWRAAWKNAIINY
jgi:hypothetical protein